jgi:hypothetical protein
MKNWYIGLACIGLMLALVKFPVEDMTAQADIVEGSSHTKFVVKGMNVIAPGDPSVCTEPVATKSVHLSAQPDPLFDEVLASNKTKIDPQFCLEEASKCALQFNAKENSNIFTLQAANLTVEARKINVTGSNARLQVEARDGELYVINKNMTAQCSKFEIKLPYCGPQNGKLYITANEKIAYFSCDGLHGEFQRLTLQAGKIQAQFEVDPKSGLIVKLGDAVLKCKSIAMELENGEIILDNEIQWDQLGIDFDKMLKN